MRSKVDNPKPCDLETLARASFADLTPAEVMLLRAAPVGKEAVCGIVDDLRHPTNNPARAETWGEERRVRAQLIEWLCLDHVASRLVHPRGIKILGAKIENVVDLSFVTLGFPILFAHCHLGQELLIIGSRTRTISLQGSRVHSVIADGAVIGGAVFFRDGFHAQQGVRLAGATIEGQLDCSSGVFESAGDNPALLADGITVARGFFFRGSRARGEVRLPQARIGADLDCEGSTFQPGANHNVAALNAEGVVVDGSVFLRHGFVAQGLVLFQGAQVGFNVDCVGGKFNNPGGSRLHGVGTALNCNSTVIRGNVFLESGFEARGSVLFVGSETNGDLSCRKAVFEGGLVAERSTVKGTLFWREIREPQGTSLNLINSIVDSLSDDSASWPPTGELQLHGLAYARISAFSPRGAKERLAWLERLKSFTPMPYVQLARFLQQESDAAGAKRVLYRLATIRSRETKNKAERIWYWVLRWTVGYGHYPHRALLWLIFLAILGFVLFSRGYYAGSIVPADKEAYTLFKKDHRGPRLLREIPCLYLFVRELLSSR